MVDENKGLNEELKSPDYIDPKSITADEIKNYKEILKKINKSIFKKYLEFIKNINEGE